jgi:predicted ABC-type transport system involved in lysophospholipase L1 biosynthesis ATPase subunit
VQTVVASARVLAPARIEIGATLTGRVTAVRVREGDLVRDGDTLVLIDTDELGAALERARAAERSDRLAGAEVTASDDDALSRARLNTLGFVFQFHHLLPAFTALENVMLPGMARDGSCTPALRAEARTLLDAVA